MPKPIKRFTGGYEFLSNFSPARLVYEGAVYPHAEAAFQAAKTLELMRRFPFQNLALEAAEAKFLGRSLPLRPDWEVNKYEVMRAVLRSKFADASRRTLLLGTGHSELIEGNYHHDKIWGVCLCRRCRGAGTNLLGQALMETRKELVAECVAAVC